MRLLRRSAPQGKGHFGNSGYAATVFTWGYSHLFDGFVFICEVFDKSGFLP